MDVREMLVVDQTWLETCPGPVQVVVMLEGINPGIVPGNSVSRPLLLSNLVSLFVSGTVHYIFGTSQRIRKGFI